MWLFEWNFHWSAGFEKLYFSMLGARKKNQRLATGYLRKVPMQETLTVSSRIRCTCFAETNQTWNYFLTWSFRGNGNIFLERLATKKRNESRLTVARSSWVRFRLDAIFSFFKLVTWLILPVVICLSQRLSHACLSINNFVLWNCEWLIKSVIVYLIIIYYLDNRGNSRANTC